MHMIIAQPTLARALALLMHAIPRSSHRPLIQHVLVTPDEHGHVSLAATDETLSIRTWLDAQSISDPRPCLLPASLVNDLVSALPPAPIHLSASADRPTYSLRCQTVQVTLQGRCDDPEEFPAIAKRSPQGVSLLRLDARLLKEWIGQVAFAASSAASSPILGSVMLEVRDRQATLAASDSFRLAMRSIPIPAPALEGTFLIPVGPLRMLTRLLPDTSSVHLLVTPDQHHLLVHTDQMEMAIRLMEGTFPPVRRVLLQESTTRLVLDTASLCAALRVTQPFAQAGHQMLTLTFEADEEQPDAPTLTMRTHTPDVGTSEETIQGRTASGPSQQINVNASYLLEGVSALGTQVVAMRLRSPAHPLILTPLDIASVWYVMMPLTVHQSHVTASPAAVARAS